MTSKNSNMKYSKRERDESKQKDEILQEARQRFMAKTENPKKLVETLTRCLLVTLQDEQLDDRQASELFLQITQLFQYKVKDSITITLRRLAYICIKTLSPQVENVFVVTSSLTNDVTTANDPTSKAAALRALCQISDISSFTILERYLKQGIADKHPVVASAALSSLMRISKENNEILRRCTYEIQEALNSDSPMVQYHALIIRYEACKTNRLAVSRLITTCIQQGLKSPLATCSLIRIITSYISDHTGDELEPYKEYIKNQLNHRAEMVEFESANALVDLNFDTSAAVIHLESFLTSSKAALKFAAVRALNKLAAISPKRVSACNFKLEGLISHSDCNRSIAILAITTLLNTSDESSVEKFLKKVAEFVTEIDEDFKVIVIDSVRQLCQKYPSKHPAMMDFLATMLREEGGFLFKKAIIQTTIKMIEENEETKEKGLRQLCEFIEDCEHESLAVEVLNLLGREGPKTKGAASYIRFIANRLLLDAPTVACAAISALAKLGVVPELKPTITTILNRSSLHRDYEVMERAVFYRGLLELEKPEEFINPERYDYADLEAKLREHLDEGLEKPFNLNKVSLASNKIKKLAPPVDDKPVGPPIDIFDIELGEILKSSSRIPLNSEISEFRVECIKYIYSKHIVFQFDVTNTVNTMQLENVNIEFCAPIGFCLLASTEWPRLDFEETGTIYTCVGLDDGLCTEAQFSDLTLKYRYKNDSTDEPTEDEFPLDEKITVDLTDFMSPLNKNFDLVWNQQLSETDEVGCTFTLPSGRLEKVVGNIVSILGMEVHNNSDKITTGKKSHEVLLGSLFSGETEILLRVAINEQKGSVSVQLKVRCEDRRLADTIIQMFG